MKKNDWVAKTRTAIEWIYILSLVGALIICLKKVSKKSHKSLACVDELRIFLDISFVISKLFCTFVI